MNLRGLVRGSINVVNRDKQIQWVKSTGYTPVAGGQAIPTYDPVQLVWAQIQPLPTKALEHLDNLNIQGVLRSVYMRNAIATAVRADSTGGDLLGFPEVLNGPQRAWLVVVVDEQWDDWCRVTAQLQNDLNNSPWLSDSSVPSDSGLTA